MKDIDIVASMFEEIKKSLEKLSKQKPSSQPTAETLSEDIISLKKISEIPLQSCSTFSAVEKISSIRNSDSR